MSLSEKIFEITRRRRKRRLPVIIKFRSLLSVSNRKSVEPETSSTSFHRLATTSHQNLNQLSSSSCGGACYHVRHQTQQYSLGGATDLQRHRRNNNGFSATTLPGSYRHRYPPAVVPQPPPPPPPPLPTVSRMVASTPSPTSTLTTPLDDCGYGGSGDGSAAPNPPPPTSLYLGARAGPGCCSSARHGSSNTMMVMATRSSNTPRLESIIDDLPLRPTETDCGGVV